MHAAVTFSVGLALMSGFAYGALIPWNGPPATVIQPHTQSYWSSSVVHPNGVGGNFAYAVADSRQVLAPISLYHNTVQQPIVTYQLLPGAGVAPPPQWLVRPSYLGAGGLHHTVVYPPGGVIPSFVPQQPAQPAPPVSVGESDIESVSDEADQLAGNTTEETADGGQEEKFEDEDSVTVDAN